MDELQLLIDLHRDSPRQGPGGDDETRLALTLADLRGASGLRVADIGCGTGASTLVLAAELDAQITAVDFAPEFLAELRGRAGRAGLGRGWMAQQADAQPSREERVAAGDPLDRLGVVRTERLVDVVCEDIVADVDVGHDRRTPPVANGLQEIVREID